MMESIYQFLRWFTDLGNSKMAAAVIFSTTFVMILIYAFTGKERQKRFDEYRYIPFMDDETKDLDEIKQELDKNRDDHK